MNYQSKIHREFHLALLITTKNLMTHSNEQSLTCLKSFQVKMLNPWEFYWKRIMNHKNGE